MLAAIIVINIALLLLCSFLVLKVISLETRVEAHQNVLEMDGESFVSINDAFRNVHASFLSQAKFNVSIWEALTGVKFDPAMYENPEYTAGVEPQESCEDCQCGGHDLESASQEEKI